MILFVIQDVSHSFKSHCWYLVLITEMHDCQELLKGLSEVEKDWMEPTRHLAGSVEREREREREIIFGWTEASLRRPLHDSPPSPL